MVSHLSKVIYKTKTAFTDFHEVLTLIYVESSLNYDFLCI